MSNQGIHFKLVTLFSLLLTLLFVYTAVSKLIALDTFQWRMERMPYIAPYASLISWAVPFLELIIAGLLWLPRYQIMALYASFVLLGCFTLYIVLVLKFSDTVPCFLWWGYFSIGMDGPYPIECFIYGPCPIGHPLVQETR